MESFEHMCKVALEAEGFVVTSNVKFFVRRQTRRRNRVEFQEHGYEVDLVGARGDRLVMASVKSYLGSRGVGRHGFRAIAGPRSSESAFGGYRFFNDEELRAAMVDKACEQYGYSRDEVEMRLYVGKFAGGHEPDVRAYLATFTDPPVRVVGLAEILDAIVEVAGRKTYTDDPVVMTVKALAAGGRLVNAPADVPA